MKKKSNRVKLSVWAWVAIIAALALIALDAWALVQAFRAYRSLRTGGP